MKKLLPIFCFLFIGGSAFTQDLIITGVFDGPLPGGIPKGIELYAKADIPDLSIYALGSANNGQGTDGEEYTFAADNITAGSFITVTNDAAAFQSFFGMTPTYDDMGDASNVNGDDAIELFMNGSVVDIFGDINVDGSGQSWEYLDSWAYRVNGTGPDGSTFVEGNWMFGGVDVFDGTSMNSQASNPFPIGSYSETGGSALAANNDNVTLEVNETTDIAVLDNDFLPNAVTSLDILAAPGNATAMVNPDNTVNYVPQTDFCGEDAFSYVVCDANSCDTAMVDIIINCPIEYPFYDIATVTTNNSNGEPDSLGVTCELQGIVYGVNLRPGGLQFVIIDGNNEGISVFSFSDDLGYTVTEGDEISIKGEIDFFNGLTQIVPSEVALLSSGNMLVSHTVVTALGEDTESQLVGLAGNFVLVDTSQWTNSGSGFNVEITNGTDTFMMCIDADVDIYGTDPPLYAFDIIGLGGQFDNSAPYDEGYQILPRYMADIIPLGLGFTDPSIANDLEISPNPVAEILNIQINGRIDELRLISGFGQLLENRRLTQENIQLDMSPYAPGFYYLSFFRDGKIWTEKIVKQ